jgi:hypothetical protein
MAPTNAKFIEKIMCKEVSIISLGGLPTVDFNRRKKS